MSNHKQVFISTARKASIPFDLCGVCICIQPNERYNYDAMAGAGLMRQTPVIFVSTGVLSHQRQRGSHRHNRMDWWLSMCAICFDGGAHSRCDARARALGSSENGYSSREKGIRRRFSNTQNTDANDRSRPISDAKCGDLFTDRSAET